MMAQQGVPRHNSLSEIAYSEERNHVGKQRRSDAHANSSCRLWGAIRRALPMYLKPNTMTARNASKGISPTAVPSILIREVKHIPAPVGRYHFVPLIHQSEKWRMR